jgi:PTS system mannose-specific IIA component
MIGGILFTHGNIGQELLRTAEGIIGKQENVIALSNEGCSGAAMEDVLNEALSKEGFGDGAVIFVDLARGSCWVTVERMKQKRRNVYVISGVNLPMLLRFFYKRDNLEFPVLVEHLREGGTAGIEVGSLF